MHPLNHVSYDDLLSGVGHDRIRELRLLQLWLHGVGTVDQIPMPYRLASDGHVTPRVAPSMICRSELELFGVSMPRFAYRVYLSEDSFVNVRRLVTFAAQAGDDWPKRPPSGARLRKVKAESRPEESPRQIIQKSSCIADAVLQIPLRYLDPQHDLFHVITTDLASAYGERDPRVRDREHDESTATPFLNHIPLGGGLCAQAACFMVCGMLLPFTRGMFGVAEITILARKSYFDEVDIAGLDPQNLVYFFQNKQVGLYATRQIFLPVEHPELDALPDFLNLRVAIRAYVLSQCPVLWECNQARFGEILKWNARFSGPPPLRRTDVVNCDSAGAQRDPHVIVLVGCRSNQPLSDPKNQDPQKEALDEFLISDPASLPMLRIPVDLLLEIALPPAGCAATTEPGRQVATMIPVTPREVRLPILDRVANRDQTIPTHAGLLRLARILQFERTQLDPDNPFSDLCISSQSHEPGTFRLIDAQAVLNPQAPGRHDGAQAAQTQIALASLYTRTNGRLNEPMFASMVQQLLNELPDASPRWLWVQYCFGDHNHDDSWNPSIWFWDAHRDPPPLTNLSDEQIQATFLAGVFWYHDGQWCRRWRNETMLFASSGRRDADAPPPPKPLSPGPGVACQVGVKPAFEHSGDATSVGRPAPVEGASSNVDLEPRRRLQPAMITSHIIPRPLHRLHESWRTGLNAELYAFMQADVDHWLAETRPRMGPGSLTALDAMSVCADRPKEVAWWAHYADDGLRRAGARIVALATFLPEVSTEPVGRAGKKAHESVCRAIRFLVQLTHALREKGHPLRTIELVTGSRVRRLWPGRKEGQSETGYFATITRDDDHAVQRVIDTLTEALSAAQPLLDPSPISFALELEPGPLYSLNGPKTLAKFNDRIIDSPLLNRYIDLNLDIAHWMLVKKLHPPSAGERLEYERTSFWSRIVHAHIAGHHRRGHFGDVPLEWFNSLRDYAPWVSFLNRLLQRPGGRVTDGPMYSGFVSLEFEAAHSLEDVEDSQASMLALTDIR